MARVGYSDMARLPILARTEEVASLFCERCGRLRNRATGRCVCDDDPSLATPVESTDASAAPKAALNGSTNATATLVAPSWGAAGRGDRSAVATPAGLPPLPQQISSLNGTRPVGAEPAPEPAPLPPLGRLRTVLGDMRDGIHRVDVRIHEDALVVDRVPGADPVLVGRVAGTLMLGPLGLLIGDALGRKRAHAQRRNRLVAPGLVERSERLPLDQLVAVTVQRLPWGGTVRIAAGGSGAKTYRWSKRDLETNDVAGQMQAVAARRFSMNPEPSNLRLAHRFGVALLVLTTLLLVALPIKAIVFPPPEPGADLPAEARTAMRSACEPWRAAAVSGPALAAVASQIRPDIERAAAASPEFAPLAADVTAVEAFAPKMGSASAPLAEAAQFSAAIDRIDDACTRVGR